MYHPTRLLAFGFAIVILMMVMLAFFTLHAPANTGRTANSRISQQLEKIDLLNELSTIIHDRTRFMQSMLLQDQITIEKESGPGIIRLSGAYNETRRRLMPLLAPREQEIMQSIDRLDRDITDLYHQMSVLFLNDSRDEANKLLLQEVLPKTAPLLSHLAELTQAQRMDVQKALLLASSDAKTTQAQIAIFAIVALLISLGVSVIAIWYGRKLSGQLLDMNTYLEQKIDERTETLLDTQKGLLEDNSELSRMALTDSLTGLPNRNYMNKILHKEFARFERYSQPFGIFMLDIDHFKKINDSYGHDCGDQVLKLFARTVEKVIRSSDVVARWGGEEFLICCTSLAEVDLTSVAENIRKMIANTNFEPADRVTVSLGGASIVRGETISELIKRADIALYEAKNNGRDRAVISEFTDISLL